MGQLQQVAIIDTAICNVTLTSSEVGTLIGMVTDFIDSAEKDYAFGCEDPDLLEDLAGLRALKTKLLQSLEQG